MSDEGQDVELRVLVAQTLENNGVLSKIRAELRASVFLALEEQDGDVKTQISNKPLKEFASSAEGSLILSLVRELLEFFELSYTLSVFDPETRCGKDYRYDGRGQLSKELKMKNVGTKVPLLAEIVRLARGQAATEDESPEKTQSNHVFRSPALSPSVESGRSEAASRPPDEDESGRANGRAREREDRPPGSAFPLLGNLPPLLNPGKAANGPEKPRGKDLNVLNTQLMGLGLGDSADNYDEDFHSSISAGSVGEDPAKESDSEIEEDINSNHSVVDDVIIDATLSNSSGVADYMEDVMNSVGSTNPKVNLNAK